MIPLAIMCLSFLSLEDSFEVIERWFSWLAKLFGVSETNWKISLYSSAEILNVWDTVSANAISFSVWLTSAKINSKTSTKTITFCLCSNSAFIWVHILSTLTEFKDLLFAWLSFFLLVPCLSSTNSSKILSLRKDTTNQKKIIILII